MALYLEDGSSAVTYIDDARIFARLDHLRAFGQGVFSTIARRFVGQCSDHITERIEPVMFGSRPLISRTV